MKRNDVHPTSTHRIGTSLTPRLATGLLSLLFAAGLGCSEDEGSSVEAVDATDSVDASDSADVTDSVDATDAGDDSTDGIPDVQSGDAVDTNDVDQDSDSGGDGDDGAQSSDGDDSSAEGGDVCIPQCADKLCGDDQCGGSCGLCPDESACNSTQTACEPLGKTCEMPYETGTLPYVGTHTTVGAGADLESPLCPNFLTYGKDGEENFYRVTAPETGWITAKIESSDFDHVLYVISSCKVGAECLLGTDTSEEANTINLAVEEGDELLLVVDGYFETGGAYTLTIDTGCTPECSGDCGPDGCGGSCGSCTDGQFCSSGACSDRYPSACNGGFAPSDDTCPEGLTFEGCCDGDGRTVYCDGGALYCVDCADSEPAGCGWNAGSSYYNCGESGSDPSGQFPKSCGGCEPNCSTACGGEEDGCGSTCPYVDCDDANDCTSESCMQGTCIFTIEDGCFIGGACVAPGPNPVNACETCDPDIDTSGWTPTTDGAPCNDEDFCTATDACSAGVCTGDGIPTECTDDKDCTINSCAGGACTLAVATGSCFIDNVCVSAGPKDGNPCLVCNSQNPKTWSFSTAACEDGKTCTEGDTCSQGTCIPGGLPAKCNDAFACTDNLCDEAAGCQNPIQAGKCKVGGKCFDAGQSEASQPCLTCQPLLDSSALAPDNTKTCSDGLACTTGDSCSGGTCAGKVLVCNDNKACTLDTCNPATGQCEFKPQVGNCFIGNECYVQSQANPAQPCEICDSSKPLVWSAAAGSKPCDDNDFCTATDTCSGGTCVGTGLPASCNDNKSCTNDSCAAGTCKNLVASSSCLIGGECYVADQPDPNDLCKVCVPDGQSGSFLPKTCPAGQVCSAGACAAPKTKAVLTLAVGSIQALELISFTVTYPAAKVQFASFKWIGLATGAAANQFDSQTGKVKVFMQVGQQSPKLPPIDGPGTVVEITLTLLSSDVVLSDFVVTYDHSDSQDNQYGDATAGSVVGLEFQ